MSKRQRVQKKLSPFQRSVVLALINEHGPLSPRQMADHCKGQSVARLSRRASRLALRGLVTTKPDPKGPHKDRFDIVYALPAKKQ